MEVGVRVSPRGLVKCGDGHDIGYGPDHWYGCGVERALQHLTIPIFVLPNIF